MSEIPSQPQSELLDEAGGVNHCNHTLYPRNGAGESLGSWIEQRTASGVRVVCRYCQKFYGYRTISRTADEDRLLQAYLEQQRRLACPGCGEEPFLG